MYLPSPQVASPSTVVPPGLIGSTPQESKKILLELQGTDLNPDKDATDLPLALGGIGEAQVLLPNTILATMITALELVLTGCVECKPW